MSLLWTTSYDLWPHYCSLDLEANSFTCEIKGERNLFTGLPAKRQAEIPFIMLHVNWNPELWLCWLTLNSHLSLHEQCRAFNWEVSLSCLIRQWEKMCNKSQKHFIGSLVGALAKKNSHLTLTNEASCRDDSKCITVLQSKWLDRMSSHKPVVFLVSY